ncbi:MAG: hypothetical protein ACAI25_10405 [Planctomycetota bacterium]
MATTSRATTRRVTDGPTPLSTTARLALSCAALGTLALVVVVAAVLWRRQQAELDARSKLTQTVVAIRRVVAQTEIPQRKRMKGAPTPTILTVLQEARAVAPSAVVVPDARDAWGELLRLRSRPSRGPFHRDERTVFVYSCGPDRRDDGGRGDDITAEHPSPTR